MACLFYFFKIFSIFGYFIFSFYFIKNYGKGKKGLLSTKIAYFKKNCAYDEPENHTSELKEKRKRKIERQRRKEGEKVKERKLAMVALLVFMFV